MKIDWIIIVGYAWNSKQSAVVFNPRGICATIVRSTHGGIEPKVALYEES